MRDAQSNAFEIVQDANMCVECSDQPATLQCISCHDDFCEVCFGALHKKGNRALHKTVPLKAVVNRSEEELKNIVAADASTQGTSLADAAVAAELTMGDVETPASAAAGTVTTAATESTSMTNDVNTSESSTSTSSSSSSTTKTESTEAKSSMGISDDDGDEPTLEQIQRCLIIYPSLHARSRYIPVRLNEEERRLLRILEDALTVSEYTDKVDVFNSDRYKIMYRELVSMLSTLAGLATAANVKMGRKMFASADLRENFPYFQRLFEIGRRHKIRNPDKMRTTYGKLMWMLMDAQQCIDDDIRGSLVIPVKTVYSVLEAANALKLLADPRLAHATAQIQSASEKFPRKTVDAAVRYRNSVITVLSKEYASDKLDSNTIVDLLAAIGDNHAYLREAMGPVMDIHRLLLQYFGPKGTAPNRLAITGGQQGARLTHTHDQQVRYCHQTYILWQEIILNMFQLWYLAESDMLDPRNRYSLRVTGQGPNRVQASPQVARLMSQILGVARDKVGGSWFGSSAVHLGDINVPNSLVFIDKYTQVERILSPIVRCIRELDTLGNDPNIGPWLANYYADENEQTSKKVGIERCKLRILVDFFRHGFDGSGAEDSFSAGSCIDGRLTSAWNWCNKIASKSYYNIFLVTGFNGFEGNWSQ